MPACCARAASGHTAVEPTITLMKSRRRIVTLPSEVRHDASFESLSDRGGHVCFGPKADICSAKDYVRLSGHSLQRELPAIGQKRTLPALFDHFEIGRASCRERVVGT